MKIANRSWRLNFCRKRARVAVIGNVGSDADHDPRHVVVARNGLDQRTFLERVVHECAHAAKDGSKDPEPQRAITLGGRNRRCLGCDRTHSVIRVVIAEAEEDEEVERVPRGLG